MEDLKRQKRIDAWGLFYESVLKPDHDLRQDSHDQKCFHELMDWRNEILLYLKTRYHQEFGLQSGDE